MIKLNLEHLKVVPSLQAEREKLLKINEMINEKTGLGSDYLGWAVGRGITTKKSLVG